MPTLCYAFGLVGYKIKKIMRSIKFKVWDTVDNEMTDWEEIGILPNEKRLIDVFEGDVERYKYLQFIGKKDSENKD